MISLRIERPLMICQPGLIVIFEQKKQCLAKDDLQYFKIRTEVEKMHFPKMRVGFSNNFGI
jgi:hypothetical protein